MINKYILLYLFSILITSISQVLLKLSADKSYQDKMKEYINAYVISAYCLFFISTILTVLSLKGILLSMAPVLESLSYLYIMILSRIILKEKITFTKILGNLLIILGVIVFSSNSILG